MRALSSELRTLLENEYAPSVLGYCWSMMLLARTAKSSDTPDEGLPLVCANEDDIIIAMEYVHAVFAGCSSPETELKQLDPNIGARIIELAGKIRTCALKYAMATSVSEFDGTDHPMSDLKFAIRSNWVLVRGKRFQVLEKEFFEFVLAPHADALEQAYGIGPSVIAQGIQRISDISRAGMSDAFSEMRDLQEKHEAAAEAEGMDIQTYLQSEYKPSPDEFSDFRELTLDLFFGGVFNATRHSGLPTELLDDLSFEAGADTSFFDGGEFSGTPFQSLPARIKPLIKIGDEHFCTDPNFIRDASYRCIQRALRQRLPEYKEQWNQRQKILSETAFEALFEGKLDGCTVLNDVYYPLPNGNWAECDCVLICDDVMIVIEAKAGTEPLLGVSESIESHLRAVERLVTKAFKQCERFLDYCASESAAPLYSKTDGGGYEEVHRLRYASIRRVFPIGLTIETFSPFSAISKHLPEITPIGGEHHFISMSIDDLLVLRRILPTLGHLLHYLDVRQGLSAIPEASLHDEIDHLGAYVSQNRVDWWVQEKIANEKFNSVSFDGFDVDVLGPFFMSPDWPNAELPGRTHPEEIQQLLELADAQRLPGWLRVDQYLRDLSDGGHREFLRARDQTLLGLAVKPFSWCLLTEEHAMVCWYARADGHDYSDAATRMTEILCIALDKRQLPVFEFTVAADRQIKTISSRIVKQPTVLRAEYAEMANEAEQIRARLPSR